MRITCVPLHAEFWQALFGKLPGLEVRSSTVDAGAFMRSDGEPGQVRHARVRHMLSGPLDFWTSTSQEPSAPERCAPRQAISGIRTTYSQGSATVVAYSLP